MTCKYWHSREGEWSHCRDYTVTVHEKTIEINHCGCLGFTLPYTPGDYLPQPGDVMSVYGAVNLIQRVCFGEQEVRTWYDEIRQDAI